MSETWIAVPCLSSKGALSAALLDASNPAVNPSICRKIRDSKPGRGLYRACEGNHLPAKKTVDRILRKENIYCEDRNDGQF